MVSYIFKLPDIGEGIAEAEIVAWHVKIGDVVVEDGPLADMMTDKATVEIESPVSGKVIALAGEMGDQVSIGSMLVEFEVSNTDAPFVETEPATFAPTLEAADEMPPTTVETSAPSDFGEVLERVSAPTATEPAERPSVLPIFASPAVRARAKDLGIDLSQVTPAVEGRVRHSDLDAFITYSLGYRPGAPTRADEQIKVVGLRRRIAENMAAAKRHIPHFSYVEEIDVTDLENARNSLNDVRGDRPKLTILPFLIVATCKALPDFPMLNARYDDEAGVVTRYGAVHMGIATQTPAGLMVPVIRDAQDRNLWQLALEIARLAAISRSGAVTAAELSGSTLTITSLGPLGGIATTPVINRPEVAILGPNRIVERCMFVPDGIAGEKLAKRKIMNISISCDHRVVDGWDAARFVQALKRLLETPSLLLAA